MESKQYEYFLTLNAENDIDEAFGYIAEELSNPGAAESFADALEENSRNYVEHQSLAVK